MSISCVNIYISKIRHLLLNELYFGFVQTFEDSSKLTAAGLEPTTT